MRRREFIAALGARPFEELGRTPSGRAAFAASAS